MGRFFAAFLLFSMLLPALGGEPLRAQPVFFSLLFEQLIPPCLLPGEMPFPEAVAL